MKSHCPKRPELIAKMEAAIAAFEAMPPDEQKAHRRAQAISFVYGNLAIENDRITRKMVEDAYDASRPSRMP